ncbi:conserved Plasmodium protein, unknown function, partial [Plasmodium ovale curtisi]
TLSIPIIERTANKLKATCSILTSESLISKISTLRNFPHFFAHTSVCHQDQYNMKDPLQIRHSNTFRLSEERIINNFTRNQSDPIPRKLPDPQVPDGVGMNMHEEKESDEDFLTSDNAKRNRVKYDTHVEDNSVEGLLHKIRKLKNEKRYLLKWVNAKRNIETDYLQFIGAQALLFKHKYMKSEFYKDEWLQMKSLDHSLINSGKDPLRQTLELFYEDSNKREKLGSPTSSEERYIANLIKDNEYLINEKDRILKNYYEAVVSLASANRSKTREKKKDKLCIPDANFQLYQQNEMLKVQNISLLEKNKDILSEELENKLAALNSSLIQVQKENIQLKEMVNQYSRLITNIRNCPEVNFIKDEMEKFKNCLLI